MWALRPVLQLLIRLDDSTVAISDHGGQMNSHPTDGRKVKEELLDGDEVETTAKWKDGSLVVERKRKRGSTVKESYTIDRASGKLILTVKISGSRMPGTIEVRRVYDPAKGS